MAPEDVKAARVYKQTFALHGNVQDRAAAAYKLLNSDGAGIDLDKFTTAARCLVDWRIIVKTLCFWPNLIVHKSPGPPRHRRRRC